MPQVRSSDFEFYETFFDEILKSCTFSTLLKILPNIICFCSELLQAKLRANASFLLPKENLLISKETLTNVTGT